MVNGSGSKGKSVKYEYFSDARSALMREVKRHPILVEILEAEPTKEWPAQLAEIAAYCNLLLDGAYMPHELEKLYDILIETLRKINQIEVNTYSGSQPH